MDKSTRILWNEDRKKAYNELEKVLGERTISKTLDAAVEITLNIFNRGAISQEIINILPKEYRSRYAEMKLSKKEEAKP